MKITILHDFTADEKTNGGGWTKTIIKELPLASFTVIMRAD